jgi:hypothetical protein
MKKMLAIILAAASLNAQADVSSFMFLGTKDTGTDQYDLYIDTYSLRSDGTYKYVNALREYKYAQERSQGHVYTDEVIAMKILCWNREGHDEGSIGSTKIRYFKDGKVVDTTTFDDPGMFTAHKGTVGATLRDKLCLA